MALDRKLIAITAPVAPGSVTYSGVGFQGKIVWFFAANAAADGTHSSILSLLGAATGSGTGNQFVLATGSTEFNGATRLIASDAGQSHALTHCICMCSTGAPTIIKEAAFTAWTSDGFTLNWTSADATAGLIVMALVRGGTDLTNVKVGSHAMPVAAGNVVTTGVGFQGDGFEFITPVTAVANENTADGRFAYGVAARGTGTAVAGQGALSYFEDGGSAAMTCSSQMRSTACIAVPSTVAASTPHYLGTMQTVDTDGFTINYSGTPPNTAGRIGYYIAYKGGQYKVGVAAQPTTNIAQTLAVGFPPKVLTVAGTHLTADGGSTTAVDQGYFYGVTDGTTEATIGGLQQDANVESYAKRRFSQTKILSFIKGTTAVVAGEADAALGTPTANDAQLTWTSVDATARRFLWLAMGDAAGAGALTVAPTGIATSEQAPSATLLRGAVSVLPASVLSLEAVAGPSLIMPTGVGAVASDEAFSGPFLSRSLLAGGIASGEASGLSTLLRGAVALAPGGMASAEAVGSPLVHLRLLLVGSASQEAGGTPALLRGAVVVVPSGGASDALFPGPVVSLPPPGLFIVAGASGSGESFGTPTAQRGGVLLLPPGSGSAEAFGTAHLRLALRLIGSASDALFGTPTVTAPIGALTIFPGASSSQEVFGTPTAQAGAVLLALTAIASAEAVAPAQIPRMVLVNAIASGEALGAPLLAAMLAVQPDGVVSLEAHGVPLLQPALVLIGPSGIGSQEASGAVLVMVAGMQVLLPTIVAIDIETGAILLQVDTRSVLLDIDTGTLSSEVA